MSLAVLKKPPPKTQQPERPNGVWDYISPSRLSTWLKCPLLFKLRYLDGVRSPTSPTLFLGKEVHHGIEVHFRHRQLGVDLEPEDVIRRMTETWDQHVADEDVSFADAADEDATREKAVRLVMTYLLETKDEQATPMAVETCLEAPLIDPSSGENLGINLLGIIDLVADDDGPQLVDFKTAARSSPPFEILHEVQLTSYSYLFRQESGQREGGLQIRSLIKTKTPQVKIQYYETRTNQHYRRLFSVIREYLDALDRGQFNYRPGWGCSMCDMRGSHCQAWSG